MDLSQRGPDPAEFDPEFVVGDEDVPSRAGTPRPTQSKSEVNMEGESVKEKAIAADANGGLGEGELKDGVGSVVPELPTNVRVKLRKLEKLESRYQGIRPGKL